VHTLVGYGKRGKGHDIQTLRCRTCGCVFSSRRNTPLYYIKTAHDRIEIVLWRLAEGVDVSVLVRYTGHVDATLTRWLVRAGLHSQRLHDRLFVDLKLPYLLVDELHAPVAGNRRHNWLWAAIEPVSKIAPAIHLGTRRTEDSYRFIHDLSLRLAPGWIPAFTSDGLRGYFYALTAHFAPACRFPLPHVRMRRPHPCGVPRIIHRCRNLYPCAFLSCDFFVHHGLTDRSRLALLPGKRA